MYNKLVYVILVLIVLQNVDGRKQRKTKQTTGTESPAPQPSVLTYSTFGFNDVRSHDGFVPTSSDYSNYPNKYKESSEKLYAPAFPSAPDPDFTSNSQSLNGESFASAQDGEQSSVQFNPANFYRSSNFKTEDNINKNSDTGYRKGSDNINNPVYGTKINYNNKNISFNGYNNSESINSETYNDHKYSNYDEPQYFNDNKPLHSNSFNSNQNLYDYTTYPTQEIENSMKAAPVNTQGLLNFPKVFDFTNSKPFDTLESENKHSQVLSKPDTFSSVANNAGDDTLKSYEDKANKLIKMSPGFKNNKDSKSKDVLNSYQGFPKYSNSKYNTKSKKFSNNYKDVGKDKLWALDNNDKKRLNNILKGYEYATNFSSTNFKFDGNEPKTQYASNNHELISSSSNNDYFNYQFPQKDYSNLKSTPSIKHLYTDIRDSLPQNIENKYNPSEDYLNKFKNLYGTVPTSSTNWGNVFKNTDYSSFKTHNSKPTYEVENYDYVHIPKKPSSFRYEKDADNVAQDWPVYNKKPNTFNVPNNEWNKEKYNNRFKSEEDLLGLRNHDTSHPSYLPTFRYQGNEDSEENFKTAVEKWREDYIKTKYRDIPNYDYEASEAKLQSVSPYQIDVPHPVIVPVPQPYPVRVPVAKPVAVPIMQEVAVPIEKPVPYPVYKKVPYPVEKLVPVPVVKQVPVPVVKPYPVAVPQVRPVFHHSRPHPHREEYDDHSQEDDDYFPRPESSNTVYNKRPKSTRSRLRRPSRMSHQERSKTRRPQRRPSVSRERDQRRFVRPTEYHSYRYRDDFDEDHEHGDYFTYCKRIGNC